VLCEVSLKMSAYAPLGGIFGGDGSKWENENFLPFYRSTSRNAITWSFFEILQINPRKIGSVV